VFICVHLRLYYLVLGRKCRRLSYTGSDAVAKHRIERGQLVAIQELAGLLQHPLIAVVHLREVTIDLLLRTEESLVQITRDAMRQVKRLGFNNLEQARPLLVSEFAAAKLPIEQVHCRARRDLLAVFTESGKTAVAQQGA
jgi:hypothetical protein